MSHRYSTAKAAKDVRNLDHDAFAVSGRSRCVEDASERDAAGGSVRWV